jgi:hypothetical protein
MKRGDALYPIEMIDEYQDDVSAMTVEHVIRWLFEFGSGYVRCTELDETWVDTELTWRVEVDKGYLKPQRIYMRDEGLFEVELKPYMSRVKLSQKALDLLKENENGI